VLDRSRSGGDWNEASSVTDRQPTADVASRTTRKGQAAR